MNATHKEGPDSALIFETVSTASPQNEVLVLQSSAFKECDDVKY